MHPRIVDISETIQERDELVVAPVDVTDQVEGAALISTVCPEALALDDDGVDLLL
jgi:hypothetical protein